MIPLLLLLAALAQADKKAPGLRRLTRQIRKAL
jgi:hypothetical protein